MLSVNSGVGHFEFSRDMAERTVNSPPSSSRENLAVIPWGICLIVAGTLTFFTTLTFFMPFPFAFIIITIMRIKGLIMSSNE